WRSVFIVAEMALALTLLVGSGLMIRSFLRLQMTSAGFNPQNLLTMRLLLSGDKYSSEADKYGSKRTEVLEEAATRRERLPGVQSVSVVSMLPLSRGLALSSFPLPALFDDNPEVDIASRPRVDVRMINSNFFRTMGITLQKGRDFTERDIIEPDARV